MSDGNAGPPEDTPGSGEPSPKRKYATPKMERLGTIRDLTEGAGMNNRFDGGSPPGQNKSLL
jgi:hypothetical protein